MPHHDESSNTPVVIDIGDLVVFRDQIATIYTAVDPTCAAVAAATALAPLTVSGRIPRQAVILALVAAAHTHGADLGDVTARVMARVNAPAN